jgi:hypothetical protein
LSDYPGHPLQQDQDEKNAAAMIAFALKNRPKDMQLVLGTVSMHGVEYKGYSINPTVKDLCCAARILMRSANICGRLSTGCSVRIKAS